MRKGTFSVQKANANSSKHNSRENAPKYLIGLEDNSKNYYELIKSDDDFILEAQQIYKEKIKQKMQKKQVENLVQETVLTLKKNQNENDVKNLFIKLNEKYNGHELLEVSVHRDEGHFLKNEIAYYPTKNIIKKNNEWYICSDENIEKPKEKDFDKKVDISTFEKVYNYHAHAKFSMFDRKLGKSARMQKKDMSDRIKFVAEQLGLVFAPGANSRVKKSVNQIKDEHLKVSRTKEKELAKVKDLNLEIENLRQELIKSKTASKEDYKLLKEEKENLKSAIKSKDLTIKELENKIATLRNIVTENSDKLKMQFNQHYAKLENENAKLQTENEHLKLKNEKLIDENDNLKTQNEELQTEDDNLKTQNAKLQDELKATKFENENLKTEIKNKKTEIEELNKKLYSTFKNKDGNFVTHEVIANYYIKKYEELRNKSAESKTNDDDELKIKKLELKIKELQENEKTIREVSKLKELQENMQNLIFNSIQQLNANKILTLEELEKTQKLDVLALDNLKFLEQEEEIQIAYERTEINKKTYEHYIVAAFEQSIVKANCDFRFNNNIEKFRNREHDNIINNEKFIENRNNFIRNI